MKKVIAVIAALTLMSSTLPAYAQESAVDHQQRDECLLASKNCTTQVDDIQKRVHKLNKEIKKGTKVYSTAELRKLQQKLDETRALLDELERPGGS